MRTGDHLRAFEIAALALVAAPFVDVIHAEIFDRIAVTVNAHVIAESETIQDIRIAAFMDGVSPVITGATKRRSADRLVDQYLVLQDAAVSRAPLPAAADVVPLMAPIRSRYVSAAEFATALSRAGITEAELTVHLLAGLQMLRYTDLRFRPEVQISEQELHDYYDNLKQKEGTAHPNDVEGFEEARDEIEKLLTGERTLQAMDRWIGMTRSETKILYHEEAFQ